MAYKNDKIRDLTPIVTSFIAGESPTAEKLQGMIRQADAAIAYLENTIGDFAGEETIFKTWTSTLARNIGSFASLSPDIVSSIEVQNYEQFLIAGSTDHELDMIPVGAIDDLIQSSSDTAITPSQYKNLLSEVQAPGDWTVEFSYSENNQIKRGRKLVTHSPSDGGSIVFKKVTSGRGSSTEGSLENTIPNLAQAESDGPFVELELLDFATRLYQITLPKRIKMYDALGEIIEFSASNKQSNVGINSQYELPSFFFSTNGMDLESNDEDGLPKRIPLNLIRLYDWDQRKEVEGIVSLQASSNTSARKYQFILQASTDTVLNITDGKYVVIVPGNSIANQIKGLVSAVYNNTGIGSDMSRLINHKNLMNLRTSSEDYQNRSEYYGVSNIHNNDHSMYFHRNGFTDSDKGAGGNVIRGKVVVGNTSTGSSDSYHENYNTDADSYALHFGNINEGPQIKYKKISSYLLDHSYGGLSEGTVDCGLHIVGATSDINPLRKNIFIDGDIRTNGNIILGKESSDIIACQGKLYINDEMTLVPRSTVGITGEQGKMVYSSVENAPVVFNGTKWISPWNFTGNTVTIGDGVNTFGKYNGTNIAPFSSALADATNGGVIKVLAGSYNFLGNTFLVPENVTIEGSGIQTSISGTGTIFTFSSNNSGVKNLKLNSSAVGILFNAQNCFVENVSFNNHATAISINNTAAGLKVLSGVSFTSCVKTIDYSISNSLINAKQIVERSALAYSGTTVNDWSLKDEILKEFSTASGVITPSYEGTAVGAIGKGCFKLVGDGTIINRRLLPINVNLGIAGHINMQRIGSSATATVGVICYDGNEVSLGSVNFILSALALPTTAVDINHYRGILVGTSGFNTPMFPVGTKFVRPFITVSSNDNGVWFDSFEVMNLTYARASSWS